MATKFSTAVRNARLDAIETAIAASAILKIRSGAAPSDCGAADSGTVLATINLAADWMTAASAGAKALAGLPVSDNAADNTGTAGHFRIYASDGVTCHIQGMISLSGGGGDMILDNTSLQAGQQFSITAFTITDGNA